MQEDEPAHHLVVDDQCEYVLVFVLLYDQLSGIRVSITLQATQERKKVKKKYKL